MYFLLVYLLQLLAYLHGSGLAWLSGQVEGPPRFSFCLSSCIKFTALLIDCLRTYSLSVSPFFPKSCVPLLYCQYWKSLSCFPWWGTWGYRWVRQWVYSVQFSPPVWSSQTENSAENIFAIQISGWFLYVAPSLCWEAWPVSSVCLSVCLCTSGDSKQLCSILVTPIDTVACLHIKMTLDSLFFLQRENTLILERDSLFSNSIDSRCCQPKVFFSSLQNSLSV